MRRISILSVGVLCAVTLSAAPAHPMVLSEAPSQAEPTIKTYEVGLKLTWEKKQTKDALVLRGALQPLKEVASPDAEVCVAYRQVILFRVKEDNKLERLGTVVTNAEGMWAGRISPKPKAMTRLQLKSPQTAHSDKYGNLLKCMFTQTQVIGVTL